MSYIDLWCFNFQKDKDKIPCFFSHNSVSSWKTHKRFLSILSIFAFLICSYFYFCSIYSVIIIIVFIVYHQWSMIWERTKKKEKLFIRSAVAVVAAAAAEEQKKKKTIESNSIELNEIWNVMNLSPMIMMIMMMMMMWMEKNRTT